jgi:hypothetical protein
MRRCGRLSTDRGLCQPVIPTNMPTQDRHSAQNGSVPSPSSSTTRSRARAVSAMCCRDQFVAELPSIQSASVVRPPVTERP